MFEKLHLLRIICFCLFYSLATSLVAQEICDNEIDDDGDGLIDCYDPDCSGISPCEDFFIGQPAPSCEFSPPPITMIELMELFRTDHVAYPIDQRAGVYVGDMNCDGIPDLVTRDNNPARIQIYSGDDGRNLQSISTGRSHPFGQVAIADVDRDGKGDIFHVENGARLARYEFGNPNPVWRTPNNQTNDSNVGTPQIADLDGDGTPEVYVGGRIFDAATGILYTTEAVNNGAYAGASNSDRFPIVHDFFQPGDLIPGGGGAVFGPEAAGMEYAAGDSIYTFDFTPGVAGSGDFQLASSLNDNTSTTGDGFTSIADINGDGRMDVAVMDGGRVYAWDPYTRMLIGSVFNVPNTGSGGRINIGDFNGDGDVELGFAGRNSYYVLQLEPNNTFSILWQRTGLDDGSQRTGSTLFDFDGDGSNEVVYSEEAFLYILNGADGTELLRIPSEAGTRTEYPLVADVNGDGTAEIIVTSQDGNGPGFSGSGWVTVYTSANQPWVPTRPVWNQHGYNVVNINDDLTVPAIQQNPLNPALISNYNNFLVQSPIRTQSGVGNFPAADATIEVANDPITGNPIVNYDGCPSTIEVSLDVDNAGAATLPGTTPIAFYQGDPTQIQASLIDVVPIGEDIPPGDMEVVALNVDVSAYAGTTDLTDVYIVVNDPGFAMADLPYDLATDFPVTGTAECIYTNNLISLGALICVEVCDDTGDNDGDGLTDEPNINAPVITGCPGEALPQFTTDVGNSNGTYSVATPNPTGTTVDSDGVVTLGTTISSYPTTVDIIFDDGNCRDTVTVSIADTEAPAIICPGNRTQMVDANCAATVADLIDDVQRNDNCSATADLTVAQSPVANSALVLGENTITITVTDEAGNSSNCTTIITTVDQTQPQLNCVTSVDVVADAMCRGLIPDLSTQTNPTDNCTTSGNFSFSQIPTAGTLVNSNAANFTQAVVVTVMDEADNQQSCTINVRVLDQTPPTATCPANQNIVLDANTCMAVIGDYRSQVATADNCSSGAEIQLTQNPQPGSFSFSSVTSQVVTIGATDLAGNTNGNACTFTVSAVDETPPSLNCPAVIMADADANDCMVTLTDYAGDVQATDACGSVTITQSPAIGTSFDADEQTVAVTATDASGNAVNCMITIQRKDVTPPVINCPVDQQEDVDANCQFALADYTGIASVSDNCTATSLVTQSPAVGTVISANQMVTLTATDEAGNATNCVFNVVLNDNIPPSISCPANQTLGVDGSCEVALPDYSENAAINDNCSDASDITVVQSPLAGSTYSGDGTMVTVSLTPTDERGNTAAACTFTVTLEDMVTPSITCPVSPQIDYVDDNCEATVPDFRATVDVSSMCSMSGFTLTQTPAPGTTVSGHNTTTLITIMVDDNNGNTASCNFDYLILDDIAPMLDCPANISAMVNGSCSFDLTDYSGAATISDNCDMSAMISFSQTPAAGTSISGAGTVQTVTLTATDQAGNASMCTFDISLEDETNPVVTCPVGVAPLIASSTCEAVIPDYTMSSTVTDNCSMSGDIVLSQVPAANSIISGAGTSQLVTITATDESNNSAQCTVTVSLEDDAGPMISCPADQELVLDGNCAAQVPDLTTQATVSDNCTIAGMITVTQDIAAGTSLMGAGTIQDVVLTADDGNGNTANCTVRLTLEDNTPPTVSCPASQNLVLDASCNAMLPDYSGLLTASDNCTNTPTLTITQSPAANTVVSGANNTVVVTFMVDDNNGNVESCSFQVTLQDQTDPMIVCPVNQTVALDADCMVEIPDYRGSATPSDACTMSGMIELTQSPAIGAILAGHNQMQVVTITANDGNGNTANCSFNVTTEDAMPPVINCPADLVVAVDNNCAFEVPDYSLNAAVTDNCDDAVDITVTQSPLGTSLTNLGVAETITLTAEDQAGNMANCTFTVTPTDQTNPDITCPAPQVVYYDANCEIELPDFTSLGTPSDNCTVSGAITISQSPAATTTYSNLDPPLVTVTLTAMDAAGNTASCDLQVELQDTISPVVTCPNDTIIALDGNCNGLLPDLTDRVIANDNCSGSSLTIIQSPDAGTTYNGDGTTVVVTFIITDSDGNESSCTSMVTFEDQSPPTSVACPANQTLTTDDVCPIDLPDYTDNVSLVDNCRAQEDIILTQSPAPGTTFMNNGTVINVTITGDDGNGNTEDCMFTVTLVDNVPLNITCPGGQIVIASNDDCTGTLLDYSGQAEVSNLCMSPAAGVSFTQLPAAGTILSANQLNQPQTVTLTTQDLNGNTASCMFEVTLIDTLPPVLVCPNDTLVAVDEGCQYFIEDFTDDAVAMDNCSDDAAITITQTPEENTIMLGPDNSQEVTIIAQDEDGNVSHCTFMVTIQDTMPPNIACPAPDTLFVNGDCRAVVPDYRSLLDKLDNCTAQGDVVVTQMPVAGTVLSGNNTNQTITMIATDASGNMASCSFDINLQDTLTPTILCPGEQIIHPDANCDAAIGDYRTMATISDNCTADASIVITQSPAAGTVLNGQGAGREVTLTASDGNGNTTSCMFQVMLEDDVPPSIVCPSDSIIAVDASCEYSFPDLRPMIVAADNCTDTADIVITQMPGIGATFSEHMTSVEAVFTADDGNGNTTQCFIEITLRDTTPPGIICPSSQIILAGATCEESILDYTSMAIVNDNCTVENTIQITQSPAAGTTLSGDGATLQVTLTANDGNGNTTDCSFSITLEDEVNPSIACPANQTIFTDGDCMVNLPAYGSMATAADNCTADAMITITQQPPVDTVFTTLGDNLVTLMADDGNGNTASCEFIVSVRDSTPPQLNCPSLSLIPGDENCSVTIADYRDSIVVLDNCTATSSVILSQAAPPGTMITGAGTSQDINIRAVDESGNASSCVITVAVSDTTRPSIICPNDTTLAVDGDCMVLLPDYIGLADATDNCTLAGNLTIVQSPDPATAINTQGTVTQITLTATDESGNQSSCTFEMTLIDTISPVITCELIDTVFLDTGSDCMFTLPDFSSRRQISDNCAANELTVVQSPSPDSLLSGLNTSIEVSLTVTDGSNNQASCSFIVSTTSDTPPPTATAITLEAIPDDVGGTTATFDLNDALDPNAASNTSNADLDEDMQPGGGPYTITYYNNQSDAAAENNPIMTPTSVESADGGELFARLEDPATGCFVLSRILLQVRPQGTANPGDEITFCNRENFRLTIEGNVTPGNGSSAVSYQWQIVNPGNTGIQNSNLLTPTAEDLQINTEGLNSGFITLSFQFFEDYGSGPLVPSVPVQVVVELTNVGAGTFPWRGND